MSRRFAEQIIAHMVHRNYEPSTIGSIARDMRINDEMRPDFDHAIQQLEKDGRIQIGTDRMVRLPEYGNEVVGTLRLNPRGFGFVQPDQPYRGGDLFIPPGATRDAVSGDRVRAEVRHGARRGGRSSSRENRPTGRVVEVIERGREHFVGVLTKRGDDWFVQADGRMLHDPVLIRDPHAKNAKVGDKVAIEMLHYPEDRYLAEGVIVKVLGEAGRPDVETQAVIVAHGLHTEFTPDVLDEARRASKTFDDHQDGPWPDREDLTDQYIFTIDPPDARDFDDAISIEYDSKRGEWTLGVHIADVATFVKRGTSLDEEARERGNSVYLPRLVLPMLPELLSNGVCSLQEGVNRFTKSAFITFDEKGKVTGQRAASTVIRSRKRLTYLEAQALIDGDAREAGKHTRSKPEYDEQLIEKLQMSDKLARILRKRRREDGMITLNLPDVELVFGDDGHVIDANPEDDSFTHTIIEMFMVEANEAIARMFHGIDIPILRRIHPDPVHGDIEELQMYARALKFRIPDEPTRRDMQQLLDATRDTPAARGVHFALLRTLSKASYSPSLIGHFALASDHYAHFTSPIRRYPDLTVHRALEAFLEHTDNGRHVPGGRKRDSLSRRVAGDDRVLDEAELIIVGRDCSDTEVEAAEAERELRMFLVLQFLQEKHLGEEFHGIVTGVMSNGVFVSIERYLVEGMVRTEELSEGKSGKRDDWNINQQTGRLHSSRSGKSIGLGDIVTVQISNIELGSRQMDLRITRFASPEDAPVIELKGHGSDHPRGPKKSKGKGRKPGKPKPKAKAKAKAKAKSKTKSRRSGSR